MNERTTGTLFLSASESLRRAFQEEKQKPCYDPLASDPRLELLVASGVKRNNPEAFDVSNSADQMVWAFAQD